MQHGQHAGSVAISPIEMFQPVWLLALVDDEMLGDLACLIAIIMEFLWRYLLLIWYHKLLMIANIQLVYLLFICAVSSSINKE